MTWVHVADRRLYCFEAGTGRPVVLLHGLALSGVAWSPQVAALVDDGFRVLVPDMTGHGASSSPTSPIGIPDLVTDLSAVLDAFGIDKADLVGVSMGGTTAMAMAATNPDRVRRLVVVNAGPSTHLPDFERMLSAWAATLRGVDGTLKLLAELWPFSVNEDFAESGEGKRAYQHWSAANAAASGSGMARVMEGVAGFNGEHLLGSIRSRSLFVAGSEDPSAELMRRLADQVAGASHVEIDGARHIANADRSREFTDHLSRFLA